MVSGTHGSSGDGPRSTAEAGGRPSIGQLVSQLAEQVARLVRAEIDLAKAEMAARAQQAGIGIGLFLGAAFLGFFAFATLVTTAILGLANAVPAWLAALIVSVVLLALTATLAILGRNQLKAGTSMPAAAVENVKSDVEAVKKGVHR